MTCNTNLSANLYLFCHSSNGMNTIDAFSMKNSLNSSEIQDQSEIPPLLLRQIPFCAILINKKGVSK